MEAEKNEAKEVPVTPKPEFRVTRTNEKLVLY